MITALETKELVDSKKDHNKVYIIFKNQGLVRSTSLRRHLSDAFGGDDVRMSDSGAVYVNGRVVDYFVGGSK